MRPDHDDILKALAEMEAHPFEVTEDQIVADPTCVDYDVYLKSKLWAEIKRRILKRDANACKRCGGKAQVVHHRSYDAEVLKGRKDDQLVSLCKGCHTFIEIDEAGKERPDPDTERLIGEHDPDAFTAPALTRIGPRKQMVMYPQNWDRMSDAQRKRWFRAALKFNKPIGPRR